MNDSSPPLNAVDIMTVVYEAIGGLELRPAEKREIQRFTQRGLSYPQSQRTSYFILGSYRGFYIHQLRVMQNELTRQLGAYPFIMRNLIELPADRLNTLDIMFFLLATYSDYIVGVFEEESSGETPELGEIDDPPYFEKSYVYPCDYSWVTDTHLESKHHVTQVALGIAFMDDLTEDETASKIKSLLERAQDTGINATEDEVREVLSNRADTGEDPAVCGWVHLNKFWESELHNRCFPWITEEELRAVVAELPSPTPRPKWEERDES